jgi:DNA-binding HxlR family transcriptional regulator
MRSEMSVESHPPTSRDSTQSTPVRRSEEPAPERGGESRHAALADALETVGDRWTLLVIAALLDGPKRFGDLQQELPGIAPNILTQRLRQLDRDALLVFCNYSERTEIFFF